MMIELLADGDRASDIRFESGHARRRRGVEAEDPLHDPDAAEHRRRGGAVRRDLKDARLSHDSAADGVFRERDLAHRDSGHAGDAVVFRQTLIEEREVGIDDGTRREVPVEQFLDEEPGFFHGGELERVVEFVVVVERGGGGAVVDLAEVEPVVGESVDEAAGLRVVEQAIGLRSENFGVAEPALRGQGTELGVRRGVPQEQGETRGEGVIVEPAGRFLDVQVAR